jgi:RNAse (barnase) inhibitor barstar
MNFDSIEPPYLGLSVASPAEFYAYAHKLNHEKGSEIAVRVVRGKKMRRLDDLYDEFAAAFQFPDYFGENWAAFDECLADLEWLPAHGYVLLVSNAVEVLGDESEKQFSTLVRILSEICAEWGRAKTPKPFHVLFQCTDADLENVQRRASSTLQGIPVSRLVAS